MNDPTLARHIKETFRLCFYEEDTYDKLGTPELEDLIVVCKNVTEIAREIKEKRLKHNETLTEEEIEK